MNFYGILSNVRSHTTLFLLLTAVMVGCVPTTQLVSPTTRPDTSSDLSADISDVTPTPTLEAEFHDLTILPGANAYDWVLIGLLENRSEHGAAEISIRVSIQIEGEEQTMQQIVTPLLSHLDPGEISPFLTRFTNVRRIASYTSEVLAYQTTSFIRALVKVDTLSISPTADGGLAILGMVTNPGSKPVALENLGLLAADADGKIKALAPLYGGLTMLDSEEQTPFIALMEVDPGEFELFSYVDAIVIEKPDDPLISIIEPPTILQTEQGTHMVVGSIKNESNQPRWAVLLLVLSLEDEIVAVAPVRMPLPLQPGEIRAYAISDFPGLRSQLPPRTSLIDDMSVEVIVDSLASHSTNRSSTPLALQITHFEPIGSSLFLRGVISNNGEADVEQAMVLVTMYSTTGELITAGWSVLPESLAAGYSAELILPLTLPQGTDPAMSEFDVQAAGFTSSE